MTPADLKAWRLGHGFTQEAAAKAIGVSHRAFAKYERGEAKPPRYVPMAIKGFESEQGEGVA